MLTDCYGNADGANKEGLKTDCFISIEIPQKRLKSPDSSLFQGRSYFPDLADSIAHSGFFWGQQGRLFVLHYINHQLYAKPEAIDEHIPL